MTKQELYAISKIYQKDIDFKCGKVGIFEVACYVDGGKYYVRVSIPSCHKVSTRAHGVYSDEIWYHSFTKEFDNKNQANAYFVKCANGCKRVK